MSAQNPGSGERPDDRRVYEGLVKECRDEGLAADKAKQMARNAMAEAERKARELGRR